VTTDACPACGYPTVYPGLCAFCRPGALTGDQTFEPCFPRQSCVADWCEWESGTLAPIRPRTPASAAPSHVGWPDMELVPQPLAPRVEPRGNQTGDNISID
jgi:hypothetical protein